MKTAGDWVREFGPIGSFGDYLALVEAVQRDALDSAAQHAEDCIANGVVVLTAGEVSSAIRALLPARAR